MWRGVHWATWSDALTDAGFQPIGSPEAHTPEALIVHLADLTRKLRRFPSHAQLSLEKRTNSAFPNVRAFRKRLGEHNARIERLRRFALERDDYRDVIALLPATSDDATSGEPGDGELTPGFVYLLKHGKRAEYKIGCTSDPLRRHGEIATQMPEDVKPIHTIETDDPFGIEKYWHKRFESKRLNGEWFKLTPADVRAFTRRKKFM